MMTMTHPIGFQGEDMLSDGDIEAYKVGLVPYYQPIIEVATGSIVAYEALARYDIDGQVSSAGKLFTDPNLSQKDKLALDQHLRRQALAQIIQLPPATNLTINISPAWIDRSDLGHLPTVEMLKDLDVPPANLVIELMEVDGDEEKLKEVVATYREHGIKIAVDDFGAGFSQLDRVISLEPDVIKLDMRLIKQGIKGGVARSAIEAMVQLCAKTRGIIVCEGVETEEEFYFALRCGAHYMQGFLFAGAQPGFLPPDHFRNQISSLRRLFHNDMLSKQSRSNIQRERLSESLGAVRAQYDQVLDPYALIDRLLKPHTDVIRYFLCDGEGNQICPNMLRRSDGKFEEENKRWRGVNWCWRPYFYRVMQTGSGRMVSSRPYQDAHSNSMCRTCSIKIHGNLVLLVDMSLGE